MAEEDQI